MIIIIYSNKVKIDLLNIYLLKKCSKAAKLILLKQCCKCKFVCLTIDVNMFVFIIRLNYIYKAYYILL